MEGTPAKASDEALTARSGGGLTADYDVGDFFDEMIEPPGRPRPHYEALFENLATLTPEALEERNRVAVDRSTSGGR